MAKRKVDAALETMDAAWSAWFTSARRVLRYGNIEDVEELDEKLGDLVYMHNEVMKLRNSDVVRRRHSREIERIVAGGIARGVDPAAFRRENGDGEA